MPIDDAYSGVVAGSNGWRRHKTKHDDENEYTHARARERACARHQYTTATTTASVCRRPGAGSVERARRSSSSSSETNNNDDDDNNNYQPFAPIHSLINHHLPPPLQYNYQLLFLAQFTDLDRMASGGIE